MTPAQKIAEALKEAEKKAIRSLEKSTLWAREGRTNCHSCGYQWEDRFMFIFKSFCPYCIQCWNCCICEQCKDAPIKLKFQEERTK